MDDDIIYPVHQLDDNPTLRGIVVTWTLRFDDVLDPDHLHRSLWQLLEIGDWRKLGGRLQLTPAGRLEIYAPQVFTSDRPPVAYSHRAIASPIAADPLGAQLPTAAATATFQPGPQTFQAFAVRADAPAKLADFLKYDTPQLSLHITSFTDATLVGLSWPHTLMDVMGQKALVQAWSLVMNKRAAEVPVLLGAREDVVARVAQTEREDGEPFGLRDQRLGTFGMIKFGLRFAWTLLTGPKVEERTFCLSPRDVAVLTAEANRDLDAVGPSSIPPTDPAAADRASTTAARPFISEGDVLTAFFLRVFARSLPSPRPLMALHALNLRFRIPEFLAAPGVYLQNMAIGAFLLLPAPATTAEPASAGSIALANRTSLAAQATEAQVLAYLRELIPPAAAKKNAMDAATLLCGPPDAVLVPFTNWTRAEFAQVIDFGGAVVDSASLDGVEGGKRTRGKLAYHHASSMVPNPGARNVFVILGRENTGGCLWCMGVLAARTWEVLEGELNRIRA